MFILSAICLLFCLLFVYFLSAVCLHFGFLSGDWAKKQATQHITDVRNGVKKDENQSLGYKIAKKVVFDNVHQALGLDQARKYPHGLASAAAPLNLDTHKYFESLDMEIVEFYGSTEASGPQTTNLQGLLNRPGSVGKDYLGVHNKILHPDPEGLGEVAVRSRNVFMGYHKSQEKTLESFEDDWFRSGDLGKIDQDGFLWLTGRLKELLITSGGENIAPVPIENNILAELPRVLSTVVVIGKFLSTVCLDFVSYLFTFFVSYLFTFVSSFFRFLLLVFTCVSCLFTFCQLLVYNLDFFFRGQEKIFDLSFGFEMPSRSPDRCPKYYSRSRCCPMVLRKVRMYH